MKRAGFTMIELIFVIVILGILSAVALPKFIGVSNQAKAGKCKAFIGTLNRTVLPTIWSDFSLNYPNDMNNSTALEGNITAQITPPSECDLFSAATGVATSDKNYGELIAGGASTTYYAKPAGSSGDTYDVNVTVGMSADTAPHLTWAKH